MYIYCIDKYRAYITYAPFFHIPWTIRPGSFKRMSKTVFFGFKGLKSHVVSVISELPGHLIEVVFVLCLRGVYYDWPAFSIYCRSGLQYRKISFRLFGKPVGTNWKKHWNSGRRRRFVRRQSGPSCVGMPPIVRRYGFLRKKTPAPAPRVIRHWKMPVANMSCFAIPTICLSPQCAAKWLR